MRRPGARPFPLAALAAIALAAAPSAAPRPAAADTFELADGTVLDGRIVQEKDGQVWIRTMVETRKVAASDVKSRTEGVPDTDRYATLKAKIEKDPKDVASMWEQYELLSRYAEQSKPLALEAKAVLARVLKADPDHAQAREANGDARFEGKWVRKEDLARLEAEAARRAKVDEWQKRLGVRVEMCEGEHWDLLDNTGSKDLSKHVKMLDDVYGICCEALGAERFWDGAATAVTLAKRADYLRNLEDSAKAWNLSQWRLDAARQAGTPGIWIHNPVKHQMRTVPEGRADAEDAMWAAVVHNSVHVAIWSQKRASEPPAWFEEGLASVVEVQVRGYQKAFCVGVSTPDRGGTTDKPAGKRGGGNKALAGEQQVLKEHAKKAMEDGEFPELRKLLRMKLGDFGPVEAGGAMGLVTWLRAKDPEKFRAMWKEIRQGGHKSDDDVWRKTYGWNLIEDMQKDFKIWMLTEW